MGRTIIGLYRKDLILSVFDQSPRDSSHLQLRESGKRVRILLVIERELIANFSATMVTGRAGKCEGRNEKQFFGIGLVSKYLGTTSLAGLGATSGQSLPRTCEFRSRFIVFRYFLSFSKLSVSTLKHVQSTRTSFGFQENYLDVFFLFFFFFFLILLIPNAFLQYLGGHWACRIRLVH